jgi:hypothetical protein
MTSRYDRVLVVLVGLTPVVAALLAVLQLDSGRRADRSSTEASRLTIVLYEDIAGSILDAHFKVNALSQQIALQQRGLSRTLVAAGDAAETAQAQADLAAATRLGALNETTTGLPSGAAGITALDGERRAAADRWTAQIGDQNAEIAETDRYGRRGSRAVFGLALVAMAGALLGLAGVLGSGQPGWIVLGTGAASLVAAAAAGASGLLL